MMRSIRNLEFCYSDHFFYMTTYTQIPNSNFQIVLFQPIVFSVGKLLNSGGLMMTQIKGRAKKPYRFL